MEYGKCHKLCLNYLHGVESERPGGWGNGRNSWRMKRESLCAETPPVVSLYALDCATRGYFSWILLGNRRIIWRNVASKQNPVPTIFRLVFIVIIIEEKGFYKKRTGEVGIRHSKISFRIKMSRFSIFWNGNSSRTRHTEQIELSIYFHFDLSILSLR